MTARAYRTEARPRSAPAMQAEMLEYQPLGLVFTGMVEHYHNPERIVSHYRDARTGQRYTRVFLGLGREQWFRLTPVAEIDNDDDEPDDDYEDDEADSNASLGLVGL